MRKVKVLTRVDVAGVPFADYVVDVIETDESAERLLQHAHIVQVLEDPVIETGTTEAKKKPIKK